MEKIKSREALKHEVAEVMQMRFCDCRLLLNLTTQEVGEWIDPIVVGEDYKWPNVGDEVIEIEAPTSCESFMAMTEFADNQSDFIARKLYDALNGKRPFNHFKSAINFLGIQEKWYAFKNEWYEEKAEDWLRLNEVDFKNGRIVTSGDTFTWSEEH